MLHQCGITYLAFTEKCRDPRQNGSGFVLHQWWDLWQEAWRLWSIGKDRGNTRYKHARKVRPTESSARNRECFLKPLCVTQRIRLGLESTSCFHQRGMRVTADRTECYRQGSRTMHFELIESHERAAYFCWEWPSTGMTCKMIPDASGSRARPTADACRY